MADLYLKDPSIITAIEAGRRALKLGLAKTYDVHFADALFTAAHHGAVLTMGHEHDPEPPLIGDAADAPQRVETALDELEASVPKSGGELQGVDQADLTPAQVLLLVQLVQSLWSWWWSSR